MKILGIDPGSTRAGYAVVEFLPNQQKPNLLGAGILQTTHTNKNKLLPELLSSCTHIVELYQPDIAGIEKLYFVKNIKTGLEVAQSRGVIICAIEQHHIPLFEYSPLEIKQGMTGYGNSDKKAIIRAVQQTVDATPYQHQPDDVFDAIAIALVTGYANKNLKNKK